MNHKHLNAVLDRHFAPFEPIRDEILEAVELDASSVDVVPVGDILTKINSTFGKRYRVISVSTRKKYKTALKSFTIDELFKAIESASKDEFHKSNKFRFFTPEYFSRIDQIDKWLNSSSESKETNDNAFIMPKMNIKE